MTPCTFSQSKLYQFGMWTISVFRALSGARISRQSLFVYPSQHHEIKICVGDPLGDVDGAVHHLRLQLPLLRPVLLQSGQNFVLWWVQFALPSSLPLILAILDFGLFLLDVFSNIFQERSNLHQGGKPNVGLVTDQWSVIGVTLLSMTVLYAFLAVAILFNSSSWWEKLLILLLAPVLDPIATPRATIVKWPASPWWFGCWGGYEGFVAVHLVWMLFNDHFYWTQVYLGSNLWVRVSLTDSLYLVETWGPALEPMQVAPPDD